MIVKRRAMLALTVSTVATTAASTLSGLTPKASAATVPTTRIRMMSCNFRMEPIQSDIDSGHGWAVRKAPTIALLKYWTPSIICGQECSTNIRTDIDAGLGGSWNFVRNGNVIIFYDAAQHALISSQLHDLPSPPADPGTTFDPRRLILAKFQMKATGKYWWAASSHFTVDSSAWQQDQMTDAVDFIKTHGDIHNTIFGGDFNNSETDDDSPRGIARAGTLFPLRDKLAAPLIRNGTSNTAYGWQSVEHDGVWIDDVLTGDNLMPYYARVVDTDGASDHQFLLVSSIQLT